MKDWEKDFFTARLELDYGSQEAVVEIKYLAKQILWLKGWPKEKAAFWNGEAFMWQNKIRKEKRELISRELKFLKKGRNLDLGCGSHSYIPSVGFDVSEKMLLLNENCYEKIVGDLEKKLPFAEGEFDSVTLIFVLDYVNEYAALLKEVFRVLRKEGALMIVQSMKEVNAWQRQQKVNNFDGGDWKRILLESGLKIDYSQKEGLSFFKCRKVY
ncbi:MAG: class I SAM-dependent methyltransferase [Candidatus Woesearchaeota archaeon]